MRLAPQEGTLDGRHEGEEYGCDAERHGEAAGMAPVIPAQGRALPVWPALAAHVTPSCRPPRHARSCRRAVRRLCDDPLLRWERAVDDPTHKRRSPVSTSL